MNLSVEQIDFTKGQRLFVSLSNHKNLEGTFNCRSDVRKSILLFNVSFVPNNGKSFPQLEFKLNEIEKIALLEEGANNELDNAETKCYNPLCAPNAVKETTQEKVDKTLYEKIKGLVEDHIFIDEIGLKFSEALNVIEHADTFAVHGEGSEEGRYGYLTLLSVATHRSVFVFDMINLGTKVFKAANSALKKTLESNRFLKVVHNCSLLSDCLKHKYGVELSNVFDTQACHLVVTRNKSRKTPLSGRLGDLVMQYLNLPSGVCEDQFTDPNMWRRRPLQDGMAVASAWRAAVLRKLKQPMDDALYAPFETLCNLYLHSVRDCDDELKVREQVHRQKKPGGFPKGATSSSPAASDSEDSWSS